EGLSFQTYSDWRMPNIKELQSIVNYGASNPANPAIDSTVFPNTPAAVAVPPGTPLAVKVWSNSPASTNAWYVNFYTGTVSSQVTSTSSYVRLVRDCTGTECN
ncbi:DUF1566 domain-containing protein, partial [Desulfobulbus sp. F4]|nr:DUF1566 domain-containing protein [Desulfobulbus sp. F4]